MRIFTPLIFTTAVFLACGGCSPQTPGSSSVETFPGELSKSQYDALGDEQKYQVANKLMATMFKGVPVSEFFDVSLGMSNPGLKQGNNFLNNTKRALSRNLDTDDREVYDVIIDGYSATTNNPDDNIPASYLFNNDRSKQLPLARMYEYPVSKDMFDHWVAYILTNTILFSPAEEIDSASIYDVNKVYNKLLADLRENKTIRQIVARHQRTQENWRRFRSPEDNTREMIEIYLGLFDRDEDVPRAAIACQDLYLTDQDEGYELVSTGFMNTRPQYVLDTFVTNCNDFYDVVASHPLLIPRVTTVLVEYFFFTRSGEDRLRIVGDIVSGNPQTFQDVFKSILFSREYLLNTERPKSIEENYFSTAHQLKYEPRNNVFTRMTADVNSMSFKQMGWPVMSLKLGRFSGVPTNAYSFANYHKTIHTNLMLDNSRWDEGIGSINRSSGIPDRNADVTEDPGNQPANLSANSTLADIEAYNNAMNDYNAQLEAHEISLAVYQKRLESYQQEQARYQAVSQMSINDYIDYVFMTGITRRATDEEKAEMYGYFSSNGYLTTNADGIEVLASSRFDDAAEDMLDYMARLSEQYYFKAIN